MNWKNTIKPDWGWAKIVLPLFEVIDLYNAAHLESPIEVLQVKEKFGTLRFYVSSAPEWIHALINHAEHMSEHTCEDCGHRGSLRQGDWLLTLCPHCTHKRGKPLTTWEQQVLQAHPEYADRTTLKAYSWDDWYWEAEALRQEAHQA